MNAAILTIRRWEFEARIFISLGLVLLVCALSYTIYSTTSVNIISVGRAAGLSPASSLRFGYLVVAAIMAVASVFRMWAGSMLQSDRIMAFKVQADALITAGPYRLVRNPIYLADLIAYFGFGLCLPPTGMLLPVLIYVHYIQIIKYEEISLHREFGQSYRQYAKQVPRLLPHPRAVGQLREIFREFEINRDGWRHNAQYVLFIAGFVVTSMTGELLHAVLIGLPGVIDWALIHTRKGMVDPAGEAAAGGVETVEGTGSDGEPVPIQPDGKVFKDVLYAQCWEDPQIDREAFNIRADDVVFSITSGGCNILTFLLDDPARVIALDLNPHQNYLLELKMRAFQLLDYEELLELVGVRPSEHTGELYERIRPHLGEESRRYWDGQVDKIERGIIHCGRFENYMRLLRISFQHLVGPRLLRQFFEVEDPRARTELFHTKWKNLRWRLFTRILLSRRVMSLLFDKAFFTYLEDSFSFGEHFAGKVEYALTRLPVRQNYFLSYIMLGRYYSEDHLPPYLRRENFDIIRNRIGRIELVNGDCMSYFSTLPNGSISKFNFTNIFEWMSAEEFEELLEETVRVARGGAILTYRNLLVPRRRPVRLSRSLHPLQALAGRLHAIDLSFIYNRYVVELVLKAGA